MTKVQMSAAQVTMDTACNYMLKFHFKHVQCTMVEWKSTSKSDFEVHIHTPHTVHVVNSGYYQIKTLVNNFKSDLLYHSEKLGLQAMSKEDPS